MPSPSISGITVLQNFEGANGAAADWFTYSSNDVNQTASYRMYSNASNLGGSNHRNIGPTQTTGFLRFMFASISGVSSPRDLTTQKLSIAVNFQSQLSVYATAANNGIRLRLFSNTARTEYQELLIGGSDSNSVYSFYNGWLILVFNSNNTSYITQTSSYNPANIVGFELPLKHLADNTSSAIFFSRLLSFTEVSLSSGDSATPGTFSTIFNYIDTAAYSYLYQKQGVSAFYLKVPVSISGYVADSNKLIEFLAPQSGALNAAFFNANAIGLKITTGATVIFNRIDLKSSQKWYFQATGGTTTFANGSLNNVGTNLFVGCTLTNVAISFCDKIDGTSTGCSFAGCDFSQTTSTTAAFNWKNTTNIAGASFTSNANAIEIATAGTYNLSVNVFTGNTKNFNITATTGTVTIVVDSASSSDIAWASSYLTAGATVVIQVPVIAVNAANFASGTRVQVSHRQIFTIASTAINTSTDVITLGNDSNGDIANFRTTSPNTIVRFTLASGATIPTSSPQIFDGGLYYWKSGGQLSITEGGAAINFTSQGSGNFILVAETEKDNSVVSSGGYSYSLTASTGALIRVKARYWQNSSGCTASGFFDQVYSWSAISGVSIPDVVSVAAFPDTIHNRIITITSIELPVSGSQTPTDDGSLVTGLSVALEGTGKVQINANDADGSLLIQDLYAWGVYVSSTAAGIRIASADSFVANDLFNYIIMNMELDNTGTIPLKVIGGRLTSDTGDTPIASTTSASIFPNVELIGTGAVISTSGGGGSSLTQQQVRDAIELTSTGGKTPISNQLAAIPTTAPDNTGISNTLATALTIQSLLSATPQLVWQYSTRSITDKSGFSLSGTQTFNLTGNISGSVGSVTAAVTLPTIPVNWITAAGISSGAITSAKFATDAIDSNVLAASAVNEIQAGLSSLDAAGVRSAIGLTSANLDTQLSGIKTKTDLLVTFPGNFSSLGINNSGHISRVTLVDTTTTNTDMRGTDGALLAENYISPPAASTIASAVQTQLADEFANIQSDTDALQTAVAAIPTDRTGYSLTGAERIAIRQEIDSNSTKLATIDTNAKIAKQGVTNRYKIDENTNTGTLYADDGTTPIVVQALKDKDGQPSSTETYERVPQ